MATPLGNADAYDFLKTSAQQAGYNLFPPFSLYATMGAMILPWIFALEWPVFGNLSLGGEIQSADRLKTQALSMLVPFYLGIIVWGAIWYLFLGMVGEPFWNAVSYLTWNGSSVLANVPSALYFPFVMAIGTNMPWMTGIFSITASIMIMCANFTIFIVCTRMIFAQTFDRLFPSRLAYVSQRTRTPVYALALITLISLFWVVAVMFYGTTLSSWFGSVQVQISFTQILTLVGALLFRKRLKHLYEQSAAARHRLTLIISAIIGIALCILIIYYMLAVPALYASLPQSEALIVVLFLGSLGYYYCARLYRRRRGIDVALAFKEIPPT
jgi:amino acid transporter